MIILLCSFCVFQFYLKSRLNCLLFSDLDPTISSSSKEVNLSSQVSSTKGDSGIDDEDEEDEEELWARMEQVDTKKGRTKRHTHKSAGEEETKRMKKKSKKQKRVRKEVEDDEGDADKLHQADQRGTEKKKSKDLSLKF